MKGEGVRVALCLLLVVQGAPARADAPSSTPAGSPAGAALALARQRSLQLHTPALAAAELQATPGYDYEAAQAGVREVSSALQRYLALAPVDAPEREQAEHDLGALSLELHALEQQAVSAASASKAVVAVVPRAPDDSVAAGHRTQGEWLIGAGIGLGVVAGVLYGVSAYEVHRISTTSLDNASAVTQAASVATGTRTASLPVAGLAVAALAVGLPRLLLNLSDEPAAPQARVEVAPAGAALQLTWRLP
jgi:hypothetical protein